MNLIAVFLILIVAGVVLGLFGFSGAGDFLYSVGAWGIGLVAVFFLAVIVGILVLAHKMKML